MSEASKPPRKPARPADWSEDWSEEVSAEAEPEEAWDDEDTSDEDTAWDDEQLLEADRGDQAEADWAPTEGDWDEALDWEEELDPEREPDDPLDDLPETPSIVGWKTRVDLPEHGIAEIPARCSTDLADSTFHVEVAPAGRGRVRLRIQDRDIELPLTDEGGELVIQLTLLVADKSFPLSLRIRATSGAPLLVLGRDALAGRFLIDVAG